MLDCFKLMILIGRLVPVGALHATLRQIPSVRTWCGRGVAGPGSIGPLATSAGVAIALNFISAEEEEPEEKRKIKKNLLGPKEKIQGSFYLKLDFLIFFTHPPPSLPPAPQKPFVKNDVM